MSTSKARRLSKTVNKKPPFVVKQAEFCIGAVGLRDFPGDNLPEIAFAGRSNAGKSTLMNRILNRRKLVRTSRTPGCTRQINFFKINERWYFVDLPGYGFARVSGQQRATWNRLIGDYLSSRSALRGVVLLLDSRLGVTKPDAELIEILTQSGLPIVPVAAKIDKLKKNPQRQMIKKITAELHAMPCPFSGPPVAVSALTGEGIHALWARMAMLMEDQVSPEAEEAMSILPSEEGGPHEDCLQ